MQRDIKTSVNFVFLLACVSFCGAIFFSQQTKNSVIEYEKNQGTVFNASQDIREGGKKVLSENRGEENSPEMFLEGSATSLFPVLGEKEEDESSECPFYSKEGEFLIVFEEEIVANNEDAYYVEKEIQPSLSKGEYEVSVATKRISTNGGFFKQHWFVEVLKNGSTVKKTRASKDGEDGLTIELLDSHFILQEEGNVVRAVHSAYLDTESYTVIPVCVLFKPIQKEENASFTRQVEDRKGETVTTVTVQDVTKAPIVLSSSIQNKNEQGFLTRLKRHLNTIDGNGIETASVAYMSDLTIFMYLLVMILSLLTALSFGKKFA